MKRYLPALAVLLFVFASIPCASAARYTISELPFDAAGYINDSGTIAGYVYDTAGYSDWSVIKRGAATHLGGFYAGGLANNDRLAGSIDNHPYVWSDNVYTPLPSSGTASNGSANGINTIGQVVGSSGSTAALWDGSQVTDLGALGGSGSWAWKINEAGQVIGSGERADHWYHAFLWDGQMHDLGTLTGYMESQASDINSSGVVVGDSHVRISGTLQKQHATLWQGIVREDLGVLGGYLYSAASGINDAGQIVGYSCDEFILEGKATLWQEDQIYDLNSLMDDSTWTLAVASDINSSGQIVGMGYRNGVQRGFLLTPVPEPSGIAALFCGLFCAGPALRRIVRRS